MIEVRHAVESEASEVLEMQRALAHYCGFPMEEFGVTQRRMEHLIDLANPNTQVYVASAEGGALAGFAIANVLGTNWRGVRPVYVEDLYTKRAFRGRGVGKALLGQCAQLALDVADGDAARAQLRLDTDREDNERTLGFYRSLGMTEEELNFRLSGPHLSDLATSLR